MSETNGNTSELPISISVLGGDSLPSAELRQPAQNGSLSGEMQQDSKSGESEEMVIITPEAEALRHKIADFLGGTSPKHLEQRRQFARHLMKSESGRRPLREAIDGTD